MILLRHFKGRFTLFYQKHNSSQNTEYILLIWSIVKLFTFYHNKICIHNPVYLFGFFSTSFFSSIYTWGCNYKDKTTWAIRSFRLPITFKQLVWRWVMDCLCISLFHACHPSLFLASYFPRVLVSGPHASTSKRYRISATLELPECVCFLKFYASNVALEKSLIKDT